MSNNCSEHDKEKIYCIECIEFLLTEKSEEKIKQYKEILSKLEEIKQSSNELTRSGICHEHNIVKYKLKYYRDNILKSVYICPLCIEQKGDDK